MNISKNVEYTQKALTWVAPAIGIPALRYFQDSKEQRNELFVRDASTYSLGALLFLGTYFGGLHLLKRFPDLSDTAREMIPFISALAVNILYAGVGSVRLSKLFSAYQERQRQASQPVGSGVGAPTGWVKNSPANLYSQYPPVQNVNLFQRYA